MNDIDAVAPDDLAQGADVQPLHQRVLAVHRHEDDGRAHFLEDRLQPSAMGRDDRTTAGFDDGTGDVDDGLLDAAGVEFRNDLENAAAEGWRMGHLKRRDRIWTKGTHHDQAV